MVLIIKVENLMCFFLSLPHASKQLTHCEKCLELNFKLQRAMVKIQSLKTTVNMLKAENRVFKSKIQIKSGVQPSKVVKSKCELCRLDFMSVGANQHLCLDQDSITCTFCSNEKSFKSTQSYLQHMNEHADEINEARKSKMFKCGKCTIGYPLEILLKCHEKSHNATIVDTVENGDLLELTEIKSEPIDVNVDANDDADDDDYVITVKVEVDDTSGGDDDLDDDNTIIVDLEELPDDVTKAIQSMSSSTSKDNSTTTMIAKRK